MDGFEEYIFTNNIGEIIQEMYFRDDEAADRYCENLAIRMSCIVICYRKISKYDQRNSIL
jgi:hypothetical protein